MYNYLIVSALGINHPGTINELTRACLQCGCNLLNAKINVFGQHLTCVLFIGGNWSAVAKLEANLSSLEQRLGLTIQSSRTHKPTASGQLIAYTLQVVAIDRPGILNDLTDFLYRSAVQIEEILGSTYFTYTDTRMVMLQLKINIPETVHLATVREKFISYCDDNNLDGFIEPIRTT